MSQESVLTAIILKKQPFAEADELVTLYTRESGKLRSIAKSSKMPKSKLQHALQPASLIAVTVAGRGSLGKIINAQVTNLFPRFRQNPEAVANWFAIAEMVLKATPDEQKNEPLFDLLESFLQKVDQSESETALLAAAAKFKIHFLDALGFGVWVPADEAVVPNHFSNTIGGFLGGKAQSDAYPINRSVWDAFLALKGSTWDSVPEPDGMQELQHVLSRFIEYQLEREIKSERFIKGFSPTVV